MFPSTPNLLWGGSWGVQLPCKLVLKCLINRFKKKSPLCSMRHTCQPASGGQLLQHLSMSITGLPLLLSRRPLPMSSGTSPSQMSLTSESLAAPAMCMSSLTRGSSCSPTLQSASSLDTLQTTRPGCSGTPPPRRRSSQTLQSLMREHSQGPPDSQWTCSCLLRHRTWWKREE